MSATDWPRPKPDSDSAPFFAGIEEGRLLLQRCGRCAELQLYFRAMCRNCWSRELSTVESRGHGTVYSSTVVHESTDPALRAHLPYTIVLVDLDEGPRVLAMSLGSDRTPAGSRVSAAFMEMGGWNVLIFEPLAANNESERRR